MSTIYVDENFHCHVSCENGLRAIETDFFDGRCKTMIEGYQYIPSGESWTREDGVVFTGEMIAPWKPFNELDQAQREYEREQAADMRAALELLGVTVDG